MKYLKKNSKIKKIKTNMFVSYFNLLYFFEIIYIMFTLLIYSKLVSVIIGIMLTILLSIHIVRIYFLKGISRKVQLYIMDIHVAYSIPYFVNAVINQSIVTLFDYGFILMRLIITCMECIFIYLLTAENIASEKY